MKIGVIADTHDNLDAIAEAVKIFNREGVELVVHAGDFVAPFTEKPFRELKAPLVGIFGNNDGDKLLLSRKYHEAGVGELYEDPHTLKIANKHLIVTHKPGLVPALAAYDEYNVVIYGHTHEGVVEHRGGGDTLTLILNPGECCGYLTGKRTVAILDLERWDAKLVEF